jgi:hypothetical protein
MAELLAPTARADVRGAARRHGIAMVAGIRTVPKSRRHPHFHIEAQAQRLTPAA